MVVDYFGITQCEEDVKRLKRKNEDNIVILDNVQAPFRMNKESEADYVFTSLRKAFPVPDGGLVRCREVRLQETEELNKFSQYKIAASYLKHLGSDCYYDDEIYLELFRRGEDMIDADYDRGASLYTQRAIYTLEVERMATLRRRNAHYLVKGLQRIGIDPIVEIPDEAVPLFVPVVLNRRDQVRKALFANQIFCPVHWPVSGHKEELERGRFMEVHELSLIVDHRYTTSDMDRMLTVIADNI